MTKSTFTLWAPAIAGDLLERYYYEKPRELVYHTFPALKKFRKIN